MKNRLLRVLPAVVLVGSIGVAFEKAFAGDDPGDDSCCWSQTCGSVTVTDCRDGCASNEDCSGDSGCTPAPWAHAKCVHHVGP
jgi:hypothetical protein